MICTILPDGTIQSLYDDRLPYHQWGAPHIRRLSHVEWDANKGGWTVYVIAEGITLPTVYATRGAALQAEVAYFVAKGFAHV